MNPLIATLADRPFAFHPSRFRAMDKRLEEMTIPQAPPKMADSRTSPPRNGRGYEVDEGIAIIPIMGDLWKEVPWLYGCSGCDAVSTLETKATIERAIEDPSVNGVLLRIFSPGGEVYGTQELGDTVRDAAKNSGKIVEAYAEDLIASGAYWVGSQTSKITANRTCKVGSLGVFYLLLDTSARDEAEGYVYTLVRSGEHKGTGADGHIRAEEIAPYQENCNSLFALFKDAVSVGRGMSEEALEKVSTGRTWIAKEAKSLGLIDAVGNWEEALSGIKERAGESAGGRANWRSSESGHVSSREVSSPEKEIDMGGENKEATPRDMTPEEFATSNPEAVEALREEGRTEGLAKGREEGADEERARVAAIAGDELLAKHPGAALAAISEGKTVVEAQASLAGSLSEKLAESGKNEDLKGKAEGGDAIGGDGDSETAGSGDYMAQVTAHQAANKCSKRDAMSAVARKNPDAYEAHKAAMPQKKR